jgi:hypothetical protein
MNKNLKAKIKAKFEASVEWVIDHPVETLLVASALATLTTKLLNAVTEARNSKTWEREVERRERKTDAKLDR